MADAASSKMIQYCQSKGWGFKETGDQIILDNCPFCGKPDHFYAAVSGSKDGLYECKKCSESGNLHSLRVAQGDRDADIQGQKEWGGAKGKTENLPNLEYCHDQLLADDDAMDYLTSVRGITPDIIVRMKLGLVPNRYFRDLSKETRAIYIPYLKEGRTTFAKYRSFPPDAKAFSSPTGWDAGLYNEEAITPETAELLFVEGEYDTLVCMSQGVEDLLPVVGVPGAGVKKTLWVDKVKHVKKKYILFDPDDAGDKGAQELAERLGLDTCYKVIIPPFTIVDDEGNEKPGKDPSDWFKHGGGTIEKFAEILKAAKKFSVKGVASVMDALDGLERELEGKEKDERKYISSLDPFNYKIGGWDDGHVTDVLAPAKVGKTKFTDWLIDDLVARYGEPGALICGEMTIQDLARMWMCRITKTDDSPAKTDLEKIEKMKRIKAAIPMARALAQEMAGEKYYVNPKPRALDELYELMYNMRRRYGVKFMGIDNLQLFCDLTLTNPAHRTIHLSKFSKEVTAIAKELGLVLFRIVQPKKLDNDKVATQNDTDGSSQIDKDCDNLVVLHRPRAAGVSARDFDAMGGFVDEENAFGPQLLINVALSRYAPGGKCTLDFNGGTSSVSVPDAYANRDAAAKQGVPQNSRPSLSYLPVEGAKSSLEQEIEDEAPVTI